MRTLWQRLSALFRRGRLDRELNDEIELHLAMQEEEFRRAGMHPNAARAAARREFGAVALALESYRERRGIPWIETALKDLHYALRGLRRNPGFAAAAVCSLALGIGANTAIFSLFHTLMLRMLPVSRSEELVMLYRTGGWGVGNTSYPFYQELQKKTDLFQGVVGRSSVDPVKVRVGSGDRAETARREYVTGNYFTVLGVAPTLGRGFAGSDNLTPLSHPIAVLSHDYWRNRFGADPGVVGRTIVVDGTPLTVVGVAARGFRGVDVDHHPDFWAPAMMWGKDVLEPGMNWLWIVARRKPRVSVPRIQAAVDVLLQQYLTGVYGAHPNTAFRKTAMAQHMQVREGGLGLSMLRDQFGSALTVLMAAVALVLLASCANLANLMLARGAARRREIALRFSLGATRRRLVRQAFTESLLLAACGAGCGALLAFWGVRALLRFLPASAGDPFPDGPSIPVLAFTVGISLLSALLFGLAPALRSTAVDPAASLQGAQRGTGERRSVLQRGLVVAQVAFSVILVAMAGLFGHSLASIRAFDLGFRNQNVVAFPLDLPDSWTKAEKKSVRDRLVSQLASLPGVSLVTYGSSPFLGGYSSGTVWVPGSETASKEPAWVNTRRVAPRYFEALGSVPVAGREFDRSDLAGARKVALVNEAFLRAFLPRETHPLDRVLSFGKSGEVTHIVGVVRDIPHLGLRAKATPTVYGLILPGDGTIENILVRSELPPQALVPAIRREAAKLAPEIVAGEPKTIRQRIDASIFQDRLLATLGGFFGGLALLLAGVGLYGVMAYGTARRAGEIGIRMALGARRGSMMWMVLRETLLLVTLGLAVGLPLALLAARAVTAILFGVTPRDPVTFALTAAVLLAAGLAAAFLPARRAAQLDPMRVLRHE